MSVISATPYFRIWEKPGFDRYCILRRFKTLGLTNRQARILSGSMARWLTNEGPRGYLLRVSNQTVAWKNYDMGRVTSIPGTSLFKDRPRQTLCLTQVSMTTRYRVLKFMKSIIKYTELQGEQWQKFYQSATRPAPDPKAEKLAVETVLLGHGASRPSARDRLSFEKPPSVLIDGEPGKKTFSPFDTHVSVPKTPEAVYKDSLKLIGSVPGYACLTPGVGPRLGQDNLGFNGATAPRTSGLIGVTQEVGGKARFFVSVHPAFQHYLTPLQNAVKARAKMDPNSFAFNQDKGRRWVRDSLKKGTVWSYDLSDATNMFPLSLQLAWLIRDCQKGLLSYSQLNTFHSVCRDEFMLSEEIRNLADADTLRFTVGQPLGLLPSAMVFHLSHIYLLRGLEVKLYGSNAGKRRRFGVVLDDVVITDKALALAYEALMDSIGVPINRSKSVVSNRLAEFLGRVITPTTIIELTKQTRITLRNVTEYARTFGSRVLNELPLGLSSKIKDVLALPESLGGAGLGNGASMVKRIASDSVQAWLILALNKRQKTVKFEEETSRVRLMLKCVKSERTVRLTSHLDDYLSSLLPRSRSRLKNAHRVHPRHGVILKSQRASKSEIGVTGSIPCVLIRQTSDYAAAREISQVAKTHREFLLKDGRQQLSRLVSFVEAMR